MAGERCAILLLHTAGAVALKAMREANEANRGLISTRGALISLIEQKPAKC